jgi:hypothetical protein
MQIQTRAYHSTRYLLARRNIIQRKKEADDIYRKIEAPEHAPPFGDAAPDVKLIEWRVSRFFGRLLVLLLLIAALIALLIALTSTSDEERRLRQVPDLLLVMSLDVIKNELLLDPVAVAKLGREAHTDNAFVRVIYHHKDNHAHVMAPIWGSVAPKSVHPQSARVTHPTTQRANNGTLVVHMVANQHGVWTVDHAVMEFADGSKRELKLLPRAYDLKLFVERRDMERDIRYEEQVGPNSSDQQVRH